MITHATVQASSRHQRRGYVSAGPLEMYYEVGGRGSPLVLLHAGFSTIETSFADLRGHMRERRNLIAFEQQGHGHTADIDRPLSYAQMVDDTAEALARLRIDDVDVFGWSDGGIVALGLALACPELVRKVAIIGAGSGPESEAPGFRDRMRALTPDQPHLADFRRHYEQVAPDPAGWATLVEKVKANYLDFRGWDRERLATLAAPLMVMAGDRDFVTLEHAVKLHRLVPEGRLAILPGCDHSAPVTHPDWVAAMLSDFLG